MDIRSVTTSLTSPTSTCPLFAIVKSVFAGQKTASAAKSKTFLIVDPTGSLCVSCAHNVFASRTNERNILPGNILKITRLVKNPTNSYSCDETSIIQIPAFEYDYERREPQSFACKYFVRDEESVVRELEKWFASQVLTFDFSQLPILKSGEKKYIDFACQVLQQRATYRNVNLTVWDGCQPNVPVSDDFRVQYSNSIYEGSYSRKNNEYLSLVREKHIFITVWKNESENHIDHYRTCSTVDISGKAGLLLFLNVECTAVTSDILSLSLRSGHHQGKAVRVVHPQSVLGREFHHRLDDAIFEAESQSCEPQSTFTPAISGSKRQLTADEIQLINSLPPHMSFQALVSLDRESLMAYEKIVHDSGDMNFSADDLSPDFGKQDLLSVVTIAKMIQNEEIEINEGFLS